ncbi:MAG: hypothetical protein M3Q80_01870 [bacterium]|nr:hypothetical protein [bacterium]
MNKTSIDFGTTVLTYNKWTHYENHDIWTHFRKATPSDISNLKAGDTIWIDEDPIHPNGKVYGFVKKKVTRCEANKIHFENGYITVPDLIYFVDNEKPLMELMATDPKITDIIGESGRMASRILSGAVLN